MKIIKFTVSCIICCTMVSVVSVVAYDITKDKCAFEVAVAHLDTQWGQPRRTTYRDCIPKTLHLNFELIRKYPNYVFPFCGAFRYWILEQATLHPGMYGNNYKEGDWDTLKAYIDKGRWSVVGGSIDEIDVNLPCAEAMCRNFLYGQQYSEDKFGVRSYDVFLPDCFGFSYSLPTIACHYGLRGFSTQKYEGGGWYDLGNSRSIMRWYGPDGSMLYAAMHPGFYGSGDLDVHTNHGDAVYNACGMWITYDYFGTGDGGGAPPEASVQTLNSAPDFQLNGAYCFSASSDSLFNMLVRLEEEGNPMVDKLESFDGELVHQTHGVGCYSTHGELKKLFRSMELSGLAAEPAAVMANKIAGAAYPQQQIWRAWFKGIDHAMHDDLTGTCDTMQYISGWDAAVPDLDSQITSFNDVRDKSSIAVAGVLNTQVGSGEVPVVVYNPLGLDRQDVVEAHVTLSGSSQYVKVTGPDGVEVPSQVISGGGTAELTILFLADVPSLGYAVYGVSPASQACQIQTGLSVSADGSTMSNNDLTVSIDNTGDISQIVDKKANNRDLFQSPSRWEYRPDLTASFPAWEIRREDVLSDPTGVVDGNPVKTVVEQGPVRVTVKVTRNKLNSDYTHYYQLCAGEAGRLVNVDNIVDWKSRGNLLKASFFFACSNPNATYCVGVGTVDRPNSGTDRRYEVPAQQWATISNGTFGVAIINRYKYGWSKMADNNLLLTLIHSPPPDGWSNNAGDIFVHDFTYAVYGYSGDWQSGRIDEQCQQYQLPLHAFQTTSHAPTAPFDKTFSIVKISDPSKAMIMCLKKAEKSNDYVVRVRELLGGSASLKLLFSYNVTAAKSTNGMEDDEGATTITPGGVNNNEVDFSIDKYQLKSFKITLGSNYIGATNIGKGIIPGSIPLLRDRLLTVMVVAGGRQRVLPFLIGQNERVQKAYITDIRGRIVHVLYNGGKPFGSVSRMVWNGTSTDGTRVADGVYFVSVITDKGQKHLPLHLIR